MYINMLNSKFETDLILLCYGFNFIFICKGSNTMREGRVLKYSLKKRLYLGPTSMDTELAMIMSNLGQVTQGSFCFDPFVGCFLAE